MASKTTNEAKISIKVLVDTEKNRVVYAEADHNFVDVLFSFMTLPMGAIIRLLEKQADDKKFESLGSLNNLYQGLVDLPVNYFSTEECKFVLLNPASSSYDNCRKLKLNIDDTGPMKYFACYDWNHNYFSKFVVLAISDTTVCQFCDEELPIGLCEIRCKYAICGDNDGSLSSGVFVSDASNFIVTDDLRVMPYSLESCIQLLKDVGIADANRLEERTVDICREQVLDLLRLSLSFDSSLTHLVLHRTQPFPDFVYGKFDQFDVITKEVASESPKIFLEVFLQKSTGKLLFAEAEEDFVEFVFGFLAISLGTVIGTLLDGASSLVCIDNIFKSISNMRVGRHLKSQSAKGSLLKPHYGSEYASENCIFPLKEASFRKVYVGLPGETGRWWETSFFTFDEYERDCVIGHVYVPMIGGLLKPSGKFVVADDLVITPPSSVSSSDYLLKLKVPLNDIEQHKVGVGLEEGLRMLKASLQSSSTVLSIGLERQLKQLNTNY
ncbi:hypothetical protein OSB04_014920 [Centaurea solstitialis]|uniref:DUF674 family protein n=1 Tax=Centaurea solstitialis TaxID=347529 RepID=A0AA38SXZ8_9ASTR|nr:hypothetical protein OSB04_014920 [Centaurea solstitialis]